MSSSDSNITTVLLPEDADGIHDAILGSGTEGLVYGMELMLSVAACYSLVRREGGISASSARGFLFLAIVIMFTNSTLLFATTLVSNVAQVKALRLDSEYNPLPLLIEWGVIEVVVSRVTYLLSDGIVIWRAWILFSNQPKFRAILGICFFVSFGSTVADMVFSIQDNLKGVLSANFATVRLLLPLALLFTNILTTLIVAHKRWQHKRFIEKNSERTGQSRADNVLVLLIKSGVIYCVIWILFVIFSGNSSTLSEAEFYWGLYIPHLTSMYPTTIILLTAIPRTERRSSGFNQHDADMISRSLQFAPRGGTTGTDSTPEVYSGVRLQRLMSDDEYNEGEARDKP